MEEIDDTDLVVERVAALDLGKAGLDAGVRVPHTHHPGRRMQTLLGVDDDRAWTLRSAVAADCKEAIDSIVALDSPRAWALRETHADIWPSTVVKSLGPLADGARGQALIARQLAAHPHSLSLLKHASAVALGVHRLKAAAGE